VGFVDFGERHCFKPSTDHVNLVTAGNQYPHMHLKTVHRPFESVTVARRSDELHLAQPQEDQFP